MSLRLNFKWVDCGKSIDQTSAATMAELEISVDGEAVTSHVDLETHLHSNSITVPLYPIAEWLISWWWSISYEFGDPDAPENRQYLERHDLAHASSGFAYPRLLLQPIGDHLEVRTRRFRRVHSPIEYLSEAIYRVSLTDAHAEFSRLIHAVIGKLSSAGLNQSGAELDWTAIGALTADELGFSRIAGRLGLDPFDTSDETAEAIKQLADHLDPAIEADLLSLGPLSGAEELLESVRAALGRAEAERSSSLWSSLASRAPANSDPIPWKRGYSTAKWLRKKLSLDGEPVKFEGDRAVGYVELTTRNQKLQGVVAKDTPTCAIRTGSPMPSVRFATARALGAHLVRKAGAPILLTSMTTDEQAVTRAFAAEFLAPSTGINKRLGGQRSGFIDEETLDRLATEFEVTPSVIAHQITNHNLGRVAQW
jgi:hypothetical protein